MLFLKELELINFMCYEYLRIPLKRITTILGKNGSGKSAILTAISLVFGGLGRERQSILRNFIRQGETQAIIRAKLSNLVTIWGKGTITLTTDLTPHDEIIIERIITEEGSYFRMNGKKVLKEEVQKVLAKVNISPRNIFFFIPQERITKLVELKPDARIDAILAGLGLLELKQVVERLKEDLSKHAKKKREIEAKINEIEKRILEQKKALESFDIAFNTLRKYYIYKIAYVYKKLQLLENKKEELIRKLEEAKIKLEKKKKKLEAIPKELSKINQHIETINEREIKIKREISKIKKKIEDDQKALDQIMIKLRSIDQEKAELIDRIRSVLTRWGGDSLEYLNQLLEDKRSRLDEIERLIQEDPETLKIRQAEAELKARTKELSELEKSFSEIMKKVNTIFSKLDPSGSLARVFSFISKNNLWGSIRGPIILELNFNVSDEKFRQYLTAFERALDPEILSSFVVVNWSGYRRLSKNLSKLEAPPKMVFVAFKNKFFGIEDQYQYILNKASEYFENLYNERKKSLLRKIESLPTYARNAFIAFLSDVVEADPPINFLLKNILLDIVIVSDIAVAYDIIKILGARKVVSIHGEVLEVGLEDEYSLIKVVPRLTTELEPDSSLLEMARTLGRGIRRNIIAIADSISRMKEDIKELEEKLASLEKALPNKLKSLWQSRTRLKGEITALEQDIELLKKLLKERDSLPTKRSDYEEKIDKLDEEIHKLKLKEKELDQRLMELSKEKLELEKKRDLLIKKQRELNEEIIELQKKLNMMRIDIDSVTRNLNEFRDAISSIKREIKALLAVIWTHEPSENTEKNINSLIETEIIEPASRLIQAASLEQISEMLAKYDNIEIDRLRFMLMAREEKIDALRKSLESLEKYRKELELINREMDHAREMARKTAKELITSFVKRVELLNTNYKYVLSKIGANGEIKIRGRDLDKMSLEITIDLHRRSPVEISRAAFSSGEKTLAIFAFLMALFLTEPTPILMLDEFDVYLDDINLLRAAKILKEISRDLGGLQVLLTTTHRVELVEIADLLVILNYNKERAVTEYRIVEKSLIESNLRRGRVVGGLK